MPFRQQAATVIRIKETSAEQLNELTKSIREVDATITRKQNELKQRVGETYLRGDDLKQYVNMLKAKSSVYKKQRAELSALEVSFIHIYLVLVFKNISQRNFMRQFKKCARKKKIITVNFIHYLKIIISHLFPPFRLSTKI